MRNSGKTHMFESVDYTTSGEEYDADIRQSGNFFRSLTKSDLPSNMENFKEEIIRNAFEPLMDEYPELDTIRCKNTGPLSKSVVDMNLTAYEPFDGIRGISVNATSDGQIRVFLLLAASQTELFILFIGKSREDFNFGDYDRSSWPWNIAEMTRFIETVYRVFGMEPRRKTNESLDYTADEKGYDGITYTPDAVTFLDSLSKAEFSNHSSIDCIIDAIEELIFEPLMDEYPELRKIKRTTNSQFNVNTTSTRLTADEPFLDFINGHMADGVYVAVTDDGRITMGLTLRDTNSNVCLYFMKYLGDRPGDRSEEHVFSYSWNNLPEDTHMFLETFHSLFGTEPYGKINESLDYTADGDECHIPDIYDNFFDSLSKAEFSNHSGINRILDGIEQFVFGPLMDEYPELCDMKRMKHAGGAGEYIELTADTPFLRFDKPFKITGVHVFIGYGDSDIHVTLLMNKTVSWSNRYNLFRMEYIGNHPGDREVHWYDKIKTERPEDTETFLETLYTLFGIDLDSVPAY